MNLVDDYFIIESLEDKDINDGRVFFESLKSIEGFNPKYFQISKFAELKDALIEFADSNYRFLFISTHGDEENLFLNSDSVNYSDLLEIDVNLREKRIFMSTCRGGSLLFARYFIKKGAFSVVGTPDDLEQIVAVGMWPTMLILFGRLNNYKVNFNEIDKALKKLVDVYQITMHFYSFLVRYKNKMKEYVYRYNKERKRTVYEI